MNGKKTLAALLALGIGVNTLFIKSDSKSIDEIILENAAQNQTVTFSHSHDITEDDRYVIGILPKLKVLGYDALALEIPHKYQPLIDDYLDGRISKEEMTKELDLDGWGTIGMLDEARYLGMKVYAIDVDSYGPLSEERDYIMFKNMKKLIFDKGPNAKVVIYVAGIHANKSPTQELLKMEEDFNKSSLVFTKEQQQALSYSEKEELERKSKEKAKELIFNWYSIHPLGYHLNQFTSGRNYSILVARHKSLIECAMDICKPLIKSH